MKNKRHSRIGFLEFFFPAKQKKETLRSLMEETERGIALRSISPSHQSLERVSGEVGSC
jgi:hypothetical protein